MRPSVSDTIIGGQSGRQVILPLNSVDWKRPAQGLESQPDRGNIGDRAGPVVYHRCAEEWPSG